MLLLANDEVWIRAVLADLSMWNAWNNALFIDHRQTDVDGCFKSGNIHKIVDDQIYLNFVTNL